MKPTILVYEMLDEGRKKKLRQIGKGLQVQVRHIRPEHYGVPLQQILQLPQDQWKIEAARQPLDAEMVVFCGLTDSLLERFLYELRRMGTVEYKAVLTPTNAAWTGAALFAELEQEHRAMHGKSPERHSLPGIFKWAALWRYRERAAGKRRKRAAAWRLRVPAGCQCPADRSAAGWQDSEIPAGRFWSGCPECR